MESRLPRPAASGCNPCRWCVKDAGTAKRHAVRSCRRTVLETVTFSASAVLTPRLASHHIGRLANGCLRASPDLSPIRRQSIRKEHSVVRETVFPSSASGRRRRTPAGGGLLRTQCEVRHQFSVLRAPPRSSGDRRKSSSAALGEGRPGGRPAQEEEAQHVDRVGDVDRAIIVRV